FFFSSRRRHTRFSRDWSSDVCSSNLRLYKKIARFNVRTGDCCFRTDGEPGWDWDEKEEMYAAEILNGGGSPDRKGFAHAAPVFEIGRASVGKECRSRWWPWAWKRDAM